MLTERLRMTRSKSGLSDQQGHPVFLGSDGVGHGTAVSRDDGPQLTVCVACALTSRLALDARVRMCSTLAGNVPRATDFLQRHAISTKSAGLHDRCAGLHDRMGLVVARKNDSRH